MNLIQAIPTMYKGIQFRSRLEAQWAATFDLLRWPWAYEPFELKGYIPDFIIAFEGGVDVLVEIKPFLRLDRKLWQPVMDKIDASGWIGGESEPLLPYKLPLDQHPCEAECNGCLAFYGGQEPGISMQPALILGATIWRDWHEHGTVGYFRDDSLWNCGSWERASIIRCQKCQAVFPYADGGERSCRRCGDNGKHYAGKAFPIEDYFNRAKNETQWRHR